MHLSSSFLPDANPHLPIPRRSHPPVVARATHIDDEHRSALEMLGNRAPETPDDDAAP